MPTSSLTRDQVVDHFAKLLQASPQDPFRPELWMIRAAVLALPDVAYVCYDDQEEDPPVALYGLPEQSVAQWSGLEHPDMMGYGGIEVRATRVGPALGVMLAGSSMSSAATVYVVPTQLLGWIDAEG